VLLGNGDGTFQTAVAYRVGLNPGALVVGDFGNGHLDIATADSQSNTVSVLLGNGDGTFQNVISYNVGGDPLGLVAADFGNGRLDLATCCLGDYDLNTGIYDNPTVWVLLGNGDGTFQNPVSYAVGQGPLALVAADFGNGQIDLVTTDEFDST